MDEDKGQQARRGGPPADKAHGLDKEVTLVKEGSEETRTITQREWVSNGQQLRAEGWSKPESEEEEIEVDTKPGDIEAETKS